MLHPSLAAFDTLDVLQLIRSENVGPVTFFQLIKRFGTPQNALEAIPQLASRGGMKRKLSIAPRQNVQKEYELTERFGAKMLKYGDTNYPALLTEIPDAPPLLILRGTADLWMSDRLSHIQEEQESSTECASSVVTEDLRPIAKARRPERGQVKQSLAIVGSRNASAASCSFTRKIAHDAGKAGLTVISGLARGIDTAAHQGALATGTVGVIAGGIDNIYPPENKPLFDALAEQGAILTENPFGAKPQSRSFPSRNRIIAGMSEGLLVVEAAPKSGSLISARYALEYNREVMAIPGSPLDPRCQGANMLIKQGATLIQSVDDILEVLQQLHWQSPLKLNEAGEQNFQPAPMDETSLDKVRAEVEQQLSAAPIQLDLLSRELQIPISILQPALLELELAGRLQRHPGGKVSLLYREETDSRQEALL